MFDMSSGPAAPADSKMLVVPAAMGLAIAIAVIFYGSIGTALDRAPIAILGGGSFALGGVLGWAVRRWRSR